MIISITKNQSRTQKTTILNRHPNSYSPIIRGALYVLFLYAVTVIFGFKIGALIFITTYVLRETKAKWPTVLMMAGSTLVLLIAFSKLLDVWWTEGLLGQWEWLKLLKIVDTPKSKIVKGNRRSVYAKKV